MQTLIRRRILWRLIWVCTVCLSPFYGALGIDGLNSKLSFCLILTGALSDITGNYRGAFYLAGAAICLSGTICFPLRRISKWENRRNNSGPNAIALSSDLVLYVSSKQNVNN